MQVLYHLFLIIFHFIQIISNICFFLPCRYEWHHRGSTHVHGFIWLENAPNMDTLDWEDDVAVEATNFFFTHMWQLGILVIPSCPHLGHTILLQMIHTVLHHHRYLHQTTQLTMKNLSILFKGIPDVQSQLAFTKKEHLFNVAMVFHMSCKLLLHYSLIKMDRKPTILQ